ncbi:MAG: LLM class flavin-dependent oxidoreductase [Chloroflexota bacterium]|nr:LLM class flavin-dependent oxidoreductase [Chloroflexota bacterium]
MRFGMFTFCRAPFDELVRLWRAAEDLGFDSAWVDDDLLSPGYGDFEPWTLLAALARESTRLQLGTLVSVITFRQPAFLAAQVLTLDHISHGRAALGLGSGGPENPYGAFGLREWSPRERAQRLEEQAVVLDSLLRGESMTWEGIYYSVQNANPPTPVQRPRPPFIIAAHGDRGLRLAARYADGWNSLGGQPYRLARDPSKRVALGVAVAQTRRLSERLDEHCRQLRRDAATLRRTVLAYWPVPDPLASVDAFDEYVGRYREIGIDELVFYWPPLDNIRTASPVSAEQWARFEHIATECILGNRKRAQPTS